MANKAKKDAKKVAKISCDPEKEIKDITKGIAARRDTKNTNSKAKKEWQHLVKRRTACMGFHAAEDKLCCENTPFLANASSKTRKPTFTRSNSAPDRLSTPSKTCDKDKTIQDITVKLSALGKTKGTSKVAKKEYDALYKRRMECFSFFTAEEKKQCCAN